MIDAFISQDGHEVVFRACGAEVTIAATSPAHAQAILQLHCPSQDVGGPAREAFEAWEIARASAATAAAVENQAESDRRRYLAELALLEGEWRAIPSQLLSIFAGDAERRRQIGRDRNHRHREIYDDFTRARQRREFDAGRQYESRLYDATGAYDRRVEEADAWRDRSLVRLRRCRDHLASRVGELRAATEGT